MIQIFIALYLIGCLLSLGMAIGMNSDKKKDFIFCLSAFAFSWYAIGLIIGIIIGESDKKM